jgi:sodium/hydrogen antiporter
VFALIALEDLGGKVASPAVAVITATVLLSVIAHGASAEPLARRYGAVSARTARRRDADSLPEVPTRRLIRRVPAPEAEPAPPRVPGEV